MRKTSEIRRFWKVPIAMPDLSSPILGEIRQILGPDLHGDARLLGIAAVAA
jgi:hypothetical protein